MDAYVKQGDVLEHVTNAFDLISSEIDPLRRLGMLDAVLVEVKRQRLRGVRQIAYQMRQQGWTQNEIGEVMGVHPNTVGIYVREHCASNGLPLPPKPWRPNGTTPPWTPKPITDYYEVQAAREG